MMHVLNAYIAIAGALCREDVSQLAKRGYRTLIDLRTDDEPATGLRPDEERQCAIRQGLVYRQIPIKGTTLNICRVASVRRVLQKAQGPVLLHCGSGRRACAFALMHLGCEQGVSVEECLVRGQRLGFDWESMPILRDFFVRYLTGHSPVHRPHEHEGKRGGHAVSRS